ncbi:MAG: RloB family protein [Lachnospiraceae bacterium]|nr:RloB family protein [Lachnospiraceae bacterium]
MPERPITKKYHFSVDGETEKWYFEWLAEQINTDPNASCRVSFDCKKKSPLKYAKALNTLERHTDVYHIFDYESNEEIHAARFEKTLNAMKQAGDLGKGIRYKSGFSNFTFELWIILHKTYYATSLTHRDQYLSPINKFYKEKFENLHQYKHEANFKRILRDINLKDVVDAVKRAKEIQLKNKENGYILNNHKGYTYYKENPSLMIWESIEKILSDCGLLGN